MISAMQERLTAERCDLEDHELGRAKDLTVLLYATSGRGA